MKYVFALVLLTVSGLAASLATTGPAAAQTIVPDNLKSNFNLDLSPVKVRRSAGGSFLLVSASVTNKNAYPVRDIVLSCDVAGRSGTVIRTFKQTVFDVFPGGKTTKITDLRIGPIPDQGERIDCAIVLSSR